MKTVDQIDRWIKLALMGGCLTVAFAIVVNHYNWVK